MEITVGFLLLLSCEASESSGISKLRGLRGNVGVWVAWIKFLRGLRGSDVFLHGSEFFHLSQKFLRELKIFAEV